MSLEVSISNRETWLDNDINSSELYVFHVLSIWLSHEAEPLIVQHKQCFFSCIKGLIFFYLILFSVLTHGKLNLRKKLELF